MSLEPVDADEVWAEAGPLVAAALEGSGDSHEEVLRQCRAGTAWLLASDAVFVVLQRVPHGHGFDFLIWVAASRGGHGCIARHLEELEQLARRIGAWRLAFRSSRRGFERALPPHWRIRQYTWAMEL